MPSCSPFKRRPLTSTKPSGKPHALATSRKSFIGQALGNLHDRDVSTPRLHTFNLDDNYGWDDGLICGGRMTVLAHPLTSDDRAADYYGRLKDLADGGTGFTEAVVIGDAAGLPPGDR